MSSHSSFIDKFSVNPSIYINPFLDSINSIQNLQNTLDQKTLNAINKYENIIPMLNGLNIGSQINTFSTIFISNTVFVPNILADILTINVDNVTINTNNFIISSNLNFKKRLIVNGHIDSQISSITANKFLRTKIPTIILNENSDDVLTLKNTDSGKTIIISTNAHNKCVNIGVGDFIESIIYGSKNIADNYGVGFDVKIMTDSIDDSYFKIGFDDPRNVVGYVENVGDRQLKFIQSNYGIVVKNYKIGDTIECVFTDNSWLFTGNVFDKDSVIMAENPITII